MRAPSLRFGALGARTLSPFPAAVVPARVLWCNFEVARQLGFSVPRENRLSRRLERQLVEAFSCRAIEAGQAAGRRAVATLHCDRYYGSAMGDHAGSARGGILLSKNVFLKGIGRTPLAGVGGPRHRDGGLQLVHAIAEAVYGELATRIFSAGAARVVAILDQGRTVEVDGSLARAAVIARCGAPYRPAHLVRQLGEDLSDLPTLFVKLARYGGVLVTRDGRPQLADTMRRILRLQARTAAEQVRWRVLHGALSTSNMGLFGEMLDVWLMTTQDRTAPMHAARQRRRDAVFGREHFSRVPHLHAMFLCVTESLTPERRSALGADGLDCVAEFHRCYEEELSIQFLKAAGFDDTLALRMRCHHPPVVGRFVQVLSRLMALRNPGTLDARTATGRGISVVDVFRLLSLLPRRYLRRPEADHTEVVRTLARIQVSGTMARRRRTRELAHWHLDRLTRAYGEVMAAARLVTASDSEKWRTVCDAMCSRAEHGHVRLHAYRRARLVSRISSLVRQYSDRGQQYPRRVQAFIDGILAHNPVESAALDGMTRRGVEVCGRR